MMSPGKRAWLQRKAERAQKRYEENKELERQGMAHTVHVYDVKRQPVMDLIKVLIDEIENAVALNCMHDKHGALTTATLDVVRKEIVARGRKRLRREKKDVPTCPMNMKFWVEIFDPELAAQYVALNNWLDNTDVK